MENGTSRIYHSPNVVNLCIDTYDLEKQGGKLWSQYAGEPVCFSTLMEAFERMEDLYDRLRYPFASTKIRSFLEGDSGEKGRENGFREDFYSETGNVPKQGLSAVEPFHRVISHRGRNGTFIIRVQYRQHSSWQGEIVWVDGGQRKFFGSVLELVRLIDNAMERKTARYR